MVDESEYIIVIPEEDRVLVVIEGQTQDIVVAPEDRIIEVPSYVAR